MVRSTPLWEKMILVISSLMLAMSAWLASAQTVEAHGCHPGRASGISANATSVISASSGNVYNRITYTDSTTSTGTSHVTQNWDHSAMYLEGSNGVASARRTAGTDGAWDGFTFKLEIGGVEKINWSTAVTDNANLVIDIRFSQPLPLTGRYDFYLNGVLRDWWSGSPYFTPDQITFQGKVVDRASQFLGTASDKYIIDNIFYERNHTLLAWPGGALNEGATFTEIEAVNNDLRYYDSTC